VIRARLIRLAGERILPHTMRDDSMTADIDRARAAAERLVEERG
jgi:hypothetical protein